MKRYTIEFESSHKQWMVIDTKDLDAQLGYHYDKADARVVADMLNQRTDLLAALEGMLDLTHQCGEDCVMSEPCPIGEQAREAIAKAKGGE
jgi:hypothetical protein|tara:strand:+ start:2988 stop:3260 length:273 start_codon:yes stop_codon:yes gene_type:complete